MTLKWLLVRRITLVALICLFAGSMIAVYRVWSGAAHRNAELAQSISRQLDLQLLRIDTMLDAPKRFPDWDLVTSYALQPGQCAQLLRDDGSVWRSSCSGFDGVSNPTPTWFVNAHAYLIGGEAPERRSVEYRGRVEGTVIVTFSQDAIAAETWQTIAPVFGFSSLLTALLCVMTYCVVDGALRPTSAILRGLNCLAKGDLDTRLPPFALVEINRISEVFNALAGDLRRASSERAEFARRLVDAQELERRHIARELHDEIAQKLSALSALAACTRIAAQKNGEAFASEAKEVENMASQLMISLRKTLAHLRPQEIDDLGLLPSLRGLIATHNKQSSGRTRYTMDARGEFESLNSETRAHVYRIIQEALNNAAKHANAQNVRVTLHENRQGGSKRLALAVVDDGNGTQPVINRSPYVGSGLVGVRERVRAMSGSFDAGPQMDGGFGLRIEFPS